MVDPTQELSALFTLFADRYDEKEFIAKKRAAAQDVNSVSDEIESLKNEYETLAKHWRTATSEVKKSLYMERAAHLYKRIETKESQLDQKQTRVALLLGFEAAYTRLESADDPEALNTTDLAETVQTTLVDDRFTVSQIHTVLTALGLPEQPLFVTGDSTTE